MEPTIKQLVLKRFRSIPSERITLDNPTIFVGRNGSGKSNLVSAFSFLAEAMASPLQAVFDKAGGSRPSATVPPARAIRRISGCVWISAA
jgi:predicted ATPase